VRQSHRRAIRQTFKTLTGLVVYLASVSVMVLAVAYVISDAADLKCEVCRDPRLLLARLHEGREAPETTGSLALRGPLADR
jgi:hypothetical protein